MSSRRRTNLKIWPSEAKYLEESDFTVKTSLAPPKSAANNEKPINKSEKKIPKKFGVKKSKVANRPKRALPKFGTDQSYVRRVDRRSKFVVAVSLQPNKKKQ